MDNVIFKYVLKERDIELALPVPREGAWIRHVDCNPASGHPAVWIEHADLMRATWPPGDEPAPDVTHWRWRFFVRATGEPFLRADTAEFLGTAVCGRTVWHVFLERQV